MNATIDTADAKLNGNQFIARRPHVFIPGEGCFFLSPEIAKDEGTTPNGVGLWTKQIEFQGKTWYQAGNLNAW